MNVKEISFPLNQRGWDSKLLAMTFLATSKDKRIECIISKEILDDHFGAKDLGYETAFTNNWETIKKVVRHKIMANDFSENGSVLVSTFDLKKGDLGAR